MCSIWAKNKKIPPRRLQAPGMEPATVPVRTNVGVSTLQSTPTVDEVYPRRAPDSQVYSFPGVAWDGNQMRCRRAGARAPPPPPLSFHSTLLPLKRYPSRGTIAAAQAPTSPAPGHWTARNRESRGRQGPPVSKKRRRLLRPGSPEISSQPRTVDSSSELEAVAPPPPHSPVASPRYGGTGPSDRLR